MCLVEGVGVSSLSVPLDNELNDHHDYSWNCIMVARP